MSQSLPIVDMSPLATGGRHALAAVAEAIGKAARGAGFFYLVGHGIDPSLVSAVFRESARFFDLPEAEKSKQSITRSPHNRGYVGDAWREPRPEQGGGPQGGLQHRPRPVAARPAGDRRRAVPRRQPVAGPRRLARHHAELFQRRVVGGARPAPGGRASTSASASTSSTRSSTSRWPPCACCTIRRSRRPPRPGRSAPASTPTTATSRCFSPIRPAGWRSSGATATGCRRRPFPAPSSATSATA